MKEDNKRSYYLVQQNKWLQLKKIVASCVFFQLKSQLRSSESETRKKERERPLKGNQNVAQKNVKSLFAKAIDLARKRHLSYWGFEAFDAEEAFSPTLCLFRPLAFETPLKFKWYASFSSRIASLRNKKTEKVPDHQSNLRAFFVRTTTYMALAGHWHTSVDLSWKSIDWWYCH